MTNPFLAKYETDEADQELIKNALEGDKISLEKLIRKHQPFVYNIAWKMVQNPYDAKDITQEAIIKAITNLSQFQGKSQFRTWLYRIVTNHFLQMKKSSREERLPHGFDSFSERLNGLPNTELTSIEKEELKEETREMSLACMSAMLLCLTREQRLVYILGELFNADHTVGAEILSISKSNFRQRLSRARKDLSHFMNNQCGLVNKANPCRCHKKVKAVMDAKIMDSKQLLFIRKEFDKFQDYISDRPEELQSVIDEKRRALHDQLPFKHDFDKKSILEDILTDQQVVELLNLN